MKSLTSSGHERLKQALQLAVREEQADREARVQKVHGRIEH